jgi:hypothetical protein
MLVMTAVLILCSPDSSRGELASLAAHLRPKSVVNLEAVLATGGLKVGRLSCYCALL